MRSAFWGSSHWLDRGALRRGATDPGAPLSQTHRFLGEPSPEVGTLIAGGSYHRETSSAAMAHRMTEFVTV
jgi:hypothetical protein